MELLYRSLRTSFVPPLRFGLRWHIDGRLRIPPHGAAILACNHTSYLDPLALGYAAHLQGRAIRFLTKSELFEKKIVGSALRNMRHVPVYRGTDRAADSLDAAVQSLRAGEIIGVFPEGTISPDLEPQPARTGTARLAQAAGVPIIPVGLWGGHRVLTKGRKPHWHRVTQMVMVGRPFRVSPDANIHEATHRLMSEIAALVADAREQYPERPKSEADAWWVRSPSSAHMHLGAASTEGGSV